MTNPVSKNRTKLQVAAGLFALVSSTPAMSASNEQYSMQVSAGTPNGGDSYYSTTPTSAGLGLDAAYAFASGYNGGFALASVTFNPGAAPLLQSGTYTYGSVSTFEYTFQVKGAPDTLVPLHVFARASADPIHISDENGVPAVFTGSSGPVAPNSRFKVDGFAHVGVTLTRGTTMGGGAGASIESYYDGTRPDGYVCNGCTGGGALIDQTIWVWSNSDIVVGGQASAQVVYNALGDGFDPLVTYGGAAASADPVFSIDDPTYAGFSIVGVPDGVAPPGGPAAVPEPAAWAMMVAGFGAVGGAMRRRTTRRLAVAA